MADETRVRGMALQEVAAMVTPNWQEPTPKQGQVVQLFFNVNLGKSHRGLRMIATEYEIDLERLTPGQYVGFLNRRRSAIKLFTSGNIYAYLRLTDAADQITPDLIAQIPRVFQSSAGIAFAPKLLEALESPIPPSATELEREEFITRQKERQERRPMYLPTGRRS